MFRSLDMKVFGSDPMKDIRNEIVHNGTWEWRTKIFICYKEGIEKSRFLLFPDMSQGHLSTVENRRHFFLLASIRGQTP